MNTYIVQVLTGGEWTTRKDELTLVDARKAARAYQSLHVAARIVTDSGLVVE